MRIVGGPASEVLAIKVAKELNKKPFKLELRKFPDGERYIRIMNDIGEQDVVVIQSMYREPNEHLFEYLLLVDGLKDLGAKRIIAFIPYLPYLRQDRRFKPGEVVSSKTVAKLIESVGTSEVYTIDAHLHRVQEFSEFFRIPAHNLSAIPFLADYIQANFELDNSIAISPDEESEQWTELVAERLNVDYDVLEKRRLGPYKVEIKPKTLDVDGKLVIIVDDIISTGGTIVEAIRLLRKEGARTIIVACTHPVLAGNALARILEAGAEAVIGTDSVPSPISLVSVAPLIAQALRKREAA